MNQFNQPFTYVETAQAPLQIGKYTVRPVARAAALRLPFGGLVWNRPVAIEVQHGDLVERLPIPDVTRRSQLVAAAAGAMLAVLFWLLWHNH